jgi:lysophospholipase L1-like esterase
VNRAIFFGDSICHGQHVSVEKVFVVRLAADYNARVAVPLLVENRSVNGNTTRQGLERLSYDVTSHRPDLVYVQFGLNDCNVWATDFGQPRVALDAYRSNLAEIVAKLRSAGTRRVVLATNHPCLLGEAYERRLLAYNDAVRDVARQTGSVLFDVRAATPPFQTATMLFADGIHLSEEGHQYYFETLRPLFMAEVSRLAQDESQSREAAPPAGRPFPVAP